MKKYNVGQIMRGAWIKASTAAKLHGGKKSEYFTECLKQEWAFRKNIVSAMVAKKEKAARVQKSTNEIEAIKPWFVKKNFSSSEAYVINTCDWIEVLSETAKAYQLKIHNAHLGFITTWAPKSCCVA